MARICDLFTTFWDRGRKAIFMYSLQLTPRLKHKFLIKVDNRKQLRVASALAENIE